MKNLNVCILAHPNLESYIFSTPKEAEDFVINNKELWAEYDIDLRIFTVETGIIMDKAINEGLLLTRPELFL